MQLSLLNSDILLEKSIRSSKFQSQLAGLSMTQSDLADEIGVNKSTISRYKRGGDSEKGRQPSLDTLRLMAKHGIDVIDLFSITTNTNPSIAPEIGTTDELDREILPDEIDSF